MGKSAAANLLEIAGYKVVDTDQIARELVSPGSPALLDIEREFGMTVLADDGSLRRDALADIVFANPAARIRLEQILHPRIRVAWRSLVADWTHNGVGRGFVVIPLLYETGVESDFNNVLCLACPKPRQRKWLAERGWTTEQVERRESNQLPIEEKMKRADFVCWNSGSKGLLNSQLREIFQPDRDSSLGGRPGVER